VEKAPEWEEAFRSAAGFLDSVADPELVYELVDHCDAELADSGKSNELGLKYGAAWEACVARLGELARAGSDEALECLVRILADGREVDGMRALMLATQIVNVGRRAMQLLRSVTGQGAASAEVLIRDIEEGKQYP
jgi:hypothetical protein